MKKIVLSLLSLFIFFFAGVKLIRADECADKGNLNDKISCYETKLSSLSSQSKTLSNQIAQFDSQIKLTTLKISQTEEQIDLLAGRIDRLEGSLEALNKAFSVRAVETYKMARVGEPFLVLISSQGLSEAMQKFAYLQKIQEADQDLIERLNEAQTTYITEKTDQEELQTKLEKEKATLAAQKNAKAQLLSVTHNDEKTYQQLLASAKAQLAALNRYVSSQGGASILSGQTKCDSWGCYYNQRDSEWGNMALGGNPYSVANYGCLVSSVAMVASHMGKNIKPSDIASNSSAFLPGYGYLLHNFSVNGFSISISYVSKSELDSRLSGGNPVIAGLYSGPDHFVVIVRKEGDSYVIHDPFPENGSYRPITEKYSVSAINSLRVVSIN
jgi:peptidoglycan hydrolase CwlO-like protein